MAVIIIARYRSSPNTCARKYFSYFLCHVIFVWQKIKKKNSCIGGNEYGKTNGIYQWYTQMKLQFYSNNCNIQIHRQTLIENISSLFVNGSQYAFIRLRAFSSWSFFAFVQSIIPLTDDMIPNKLMIRKGLYAIIDITYFSQFLLLMLIIL